MIYAFVFDHHCTHKNSNKKRTQRLRSRTERTAQDEETQRQSFDLNYTTQTEPIRGTNHQKPTLQLQSKQQTTKTRQRADLVDVVEVHAFLLFALQQLQTQQRMRQQLHVSEHREANCEVEQ